MNKVIYAARFFYYSPLPRCGSKIWLTLCLFIATSLVYGQYCLPNYQVTSCGSGDYISGVQFNTINNQNAVCPPVNANNTDYSGTFCTSVCPGASYQITITNNPNNGEYIAVCIDMNCDGTFSDPGDFFPIGYVSPGGVISANIIIPQNAVAGNSKLRVFCQSGLAPLTQPQVCGNLAAGEVQDYCLTINPGVSVNLGNPVTQCGGSVTLNAGNPGSAYLWSDGSSNQALQVSASGNYSTTVTSANSCTATSSVQVYIKPVPVVYLGSNIASCGGTVTLNAANPGQAYAWSDGETTQSIIADTSGAYSVTVTETSSGCPASDTVEVTIDSVPTVNLNTVAPQCGGFDTLDAGNAGAGYLWSDGSTNETLIISGSGIYRVTVTNSNQCPATASASVTIHPLPVVTLNIQPNVCNTVANFVLYGGAPAGGTYYVDYAADTSFNTIDAGIVGHNISYIYTDTFGCADSADSYITVRKHPFITTVDFPPTCAGSAPLDLNNYFTPAGGVYIGLGVSTHYFYPPLSGSGNDTIIDIVIDNYGCVDTSVFPLIINPSVHVSMTPGVLDNAVCAGQTVSFNAAGAMQYQFFINGVAQDSMSPTSSFSTFSLLNADVVTVVGSNACSTDTSAPVGFEVHALPVVSAGDDTSVALGQSVQLNGVASGSGLLVYQWNPASVLNIVNIPDPVYSGSADSVVFTLIVSDVYGCIDSSHVTVRVYVPDAIVLPNIITPDGNGKNDTWKINSRVDLAGSRLIIFNRWGETVFYEQNYSNDWGGTYMNTGEKLPDATYYYELTVPSQDNHLYKGAINILNSSAK
jgi:gliding motility-associated-like protein